MSVIAGWSYFLLSHQRHHQQRKQLEARKILLLSLSHFDFGHKHLILKQLKSSIMPVRKTETAKSLKQLSLECVTEHFDVYYYERYKDSIARHHVVGPFDMLRKYITDSFNFILF